MTRNDKMVVEEKVFNNRGRIYCRQAIRQYWIADILDTGASKSFMPKSHYLPCKSLHSLSKFASNTQRIQVGNGQYVSVLFIIPVIINIYGHWFEIYTLVSEIHENVDMVLGIKNVFELEGVINSWECCFSFLNRYVSIFPKEKIILKLKENRRKQKLIKIEAPFLDVILGFAIIKLFESQLRVL